MPFLFGNTPAEVAQSGMRLAERNRDAQIRANELGANYAFQTRQMENQDAMNLAALARQMQEQENALARENESIGERRYQFGQQAQAAKRAEDFQRFQFGKSLESDRARMDLQREQMNLSRTPKTSVEDEAMLYTEQLAPLVGALEQATANRAEAERAAREVAAAAARVGLSRLPGGKNFKFGASGEVPNVRPLAFDDAFNAAQRELAKAAKSEEQVRNAYERNLTNLENLGLKKGFKVDRQGRRIVTPTAEFSFGAPSAPRASAAAQPGQQPAYRVSSSGVITPLTTTPLPGFDQPEYSER